MSSATTSGVRLTYWCHECDMSVSLVFSTTTTTTPLQVLCPHCQSNFLEHMESINPNSPIPLLPQQLTTESDFNFNFLEFDYECDEDNDIPSNSVASTSSSLNSSMSSVEISVSLSQESCAICKDEFSVDSEAKQLPCKHLYHSQCILAWLSHQSSCPLCRFQLPIPIAAKDN